jgi:hypothetical protein
LHFPNINQRRALTGELYSSLEQPHLISDPSLTRTRPSCSKTAAGSCRIASVLPVWVNGPLPVL